MNTKNLIEGLLLLDNYRNEQHGYNLGAEHDVIYAYPTDKRLSDEDAQKMIDLGWIQEHDDRDYEGDMTLEEYREDEAWQAFV